MSQDCDVGATAVRHPLHTVIGMTKNLLAIAALTVLVLSASGCSLGITDPGSGAQQPGQNAGEGAGNGAGEGAGDGAGELASGAASGACDDRDLLVDEDGSNLVLTGSCGVVTITASEVAINLETAEGVIVSGSNVTVLATHIDAAEVSGDNVTLNPDTIGSLEFSGDYNTLIAQEADEIAISGNFNIANWSAGAASANDTGNDNTVVAP